jgi:hypothetical protein
MKLATFEVETSLGPKQRLGAVHPASDDSLVDITTGYAAILREEGVTAADRVARGTVPPSMQSFLATGDRGFEAVTQVLISALMTVAGGGWFTIGVVILLLLAFPFRNDRPWAVYALPAIILLFYLPNLSATLSVLQNTPGTPPWQGNVVACLSAVVGLALYPKPLIDQC